MSWRDDDWFTADSVSHILAAAEEFQHASVGDLRLSNLDFVKHIESFQHERLDLSRRTITFGIDTAGCKTVVLANHPAACESLVHKDSLLGCAYCVKSILPTTENWLRKLYIYSLNNNTSTEDKHETNHINNKYNDTKPDTRKLHNL